MKNKLTTIAIFVLVIVAASTATYFTTKHYVFSDAYRTGSSVGYKSGYSKGFDGAVNKFTSASDPCTPLVIGGQNGTSQSLAYSSSCPQSQQSQAATTTSTTEPTVPIANSSIHCTSTKQYYSKTVYTDCY